jgi:hypothetical protein
MVFVLVVCTHGFHSHVGMCDCHQSWVPRESSVSWLYCVFVGSSRPTGTAEGKRWQGTGVGIGAVVVMPHEPFQGSELGAPEMSI